MKHYFRLLILLSVVGGFLVSCEPESDDDPSVQYSASDFVGTWAVSENSTEFGPQSYTVVITQGNESSEILIKNFYNLGTNTVTEAILSTNKLILPSQTISGHLLEGNGNIINTSTLDWTFTAHDGVTQDQVSADFVKQ